MGKFTKQPGLGRGAATGVFARGYVDNKGLRVAPQVGLEPTTLRLTAECSTIELLRSKVVPLFNQTASSSVKSHGPSGYWRASIAFANCSRNAVQSWTPKRRSWSLSPRWKAAIRPLIRASAACAAGEPAFALARRARVSR